MELRYEKFKKMFKFLAAFFLQCVYSLSFAFVWYNDLNRLMDRAFENKGNWLVIASYFLVVLIFMQVYGGFKIGYLSKWNVVFSQWLALFIANLVICMQCILMIGRLAHIPRIIGHIAEMTVVQWMLSVVLTLLITLLFERIYPPKRLLLIYETYSPEDFISKISERKDKYYIEKCVNISDGWENVREEILNYQSVLLYDISAQNRNLILKYCYQKDKEIYMTSKISDVILRSSKDILLFDTPLLLAQNSGLSWFQKAVKRLVDLVIAVLGLVITSPILLIVAVCIKVCDGGPVFFFQERCTLGGKVFRICKFRSMIVDAEKDGKSRPATDDDDRITPVGKVIRKTRIDELPQLFNVLKGDMSIVGPRPERVEHVEIYTKEIPEFVYRMKVKGGLTGYAQVYGKYNTTAYDKLKMDLMYIENYSFLLDVKLILMTIKVMFMKASTEGFSEKQQKGISDGGDRPWTEKTNDGAGNERS